MSRPRKKILIYHPSENDGALMRYAMETTLLVRVTLADRAEELDIPSEDIQVNVRWCGEEIEIRNRSTKIWRTLPATCAKIEFMEAVRLALIRRRGPLPNPNSRRQKKEAAAMKRVAA